MIEWKWTNNIIMKIRVNPDFNYEILDAALELCVIILIIILTLLTHKNGEYLYSLYTSS